MGYLLPARPTAQCSVQAFLILLTTLQGRCFAPHSADKQIELKHGCRVGRGGHRCWSLPQPALGILGGVMLGTKKIVQIARASLRRDWGAL